MKTDDFLRRLEPLLPGQVARWRRNLDLGDPELRAALARQIASVAHRKLGDPRQMFLSLPPKKKAGGPIGLGTVRYENPKWPAGLAEGELLQGLAIFGRSGAGKTNVSFHVLRQLAKRRIPFVFLDWKRTARHLIPGLEGRVHVYTPGRDLARFPFNPFLPPPGLEPRVYTNFAVDVLCDSFTLGDGARSLLQKALLACFNEHSPPTAQALLARIRDVPDRERVSGWKTSAIRALETIDLMTRETADVSQRSMVEGLLERSTIIELDGLSPSNKRFLVPLVSLWIYYTKLLSRERERLRLVLVIEEAHHVLYQHRNQNESVMEMLLRQCREIGMGVVVIDQHPHLISSAALGNTYTSVCLNLKDPKDISKAAALSLVPREDAKHISLLPVGRGIVKLQDRWQRPFVVDFPLVSVNKGAVTDEVLRAYLEGRGTLSAMRPAEVPGVDALARARVPDEVLERNAAHLFRDVRLHPDDGVDARYKRLGFSADKGHRLKLKLLALGMLEEQIVPVDRTRKTLLRVTRRVPDLRGDSIGHRRETIAHEYWKRRYAGLFKERGFEVEVEAERGEGRMDVLARKGDEVVAIEIETGQSDVVQNVRQDLLFGCSRVLVVATTERAWAEVNKRLKMSGLVFPRIELALPRKESSIGDCA